MSSVITREQAQAAEAEARRAEVEADQATKEAASRRLAADQAARDADEQRQRFERQMRGLELNAGKELRSFQQQVEKVLAAKVSPSSLSADLRGLARKFLHSGIDATELDRLALDERLGEVLGMQRAAGQLMGNLAATGITDPALTTFADAIETKCWRALLARVRLVAGESE